MDNQIRISAKDIGELSLPNFCPRCFWFKRKAPKGLPFQIFPGIFSSIDSYTKRYVHKWLDTYKKAPPWLSSLGDIKGYINPPHFTKFNIIDDEYNILLTGNPDGIFVLTDGSKLIIDYKTAKFTKTADELFPIYETQLNVYALIGEQRDISPISGLFLIYTEPQTSDDYINKGTSKREFGFALDFSAKILEVKLDTTIIKPLLLSTREIYELKSPPNGRDGCKDCEKLDGIFSISRFNT